MKFIASRDLRIKPGQVWKDLKKEQTLVVTSHGQPVALMMPVTGEELEDALHMLARMRLKRTVRAIQANSVRHGLDKMTMEEIDEVIAEARREAKQ
jgi:antitoxin (DNA-binding transcriptional repressor) of toxin-antitoxin stability system